MGVNAKRRDPEQFKVHLRVWNRRGQARWSGRCEEKQQEHTMSTTSADRYATPFDSRTAVLIRNWWAVALRGALAILFGLVALFFPAETMLALVLVFAAYVLVDGIFAIIAAVRAARAGDRWGMLAFAGAVSIATGIVAVLWPGLTVIAFVLLVAAWALVTGSLMLGAAFRLSPDDGRWWLALGGVASVAYGVLLIVAPLIGALVLTWWLGAWALVFGVILLVLAYKLRSRQLDRSPTAAARAA
jgi:uncharacterized membrane protein HdeD (DUF308 family)